ncbi:MAG: hypothetical protein AAGH74_05060 [Pseudomonadota bacterium]
MVLGQLNALFDKDKTPDPFRAFLLSLILTTSLVISLALPVLIIGGAGYGIWWLFGWGAGDYLSLFEGFAQGLTETQAP